MAAQRLTFAELGLANLTVDAVQEGGRSRDPGDDPRHPLRGARNLARLGHPQRTKRCKMTPLGANDGKEE